jgi:hypothetical protein
MNEDELDIVRRAFAKQVMAAARIDDQRVETAYAFYPARKNTVSCPNATLGASTGRITLRMCL